jgi:hypothetical protein
MIEHLAVIMLNQWWIVGIFVSAFLVLVAVSFADDNKYRISILLSIYCGLLFVVCGLVSVASFLHTRLGEGLIMGLLAMTAMAVSMQTYATRNDPDVFEDPYRY